MIAYYAISSSALRNAISYELQPTAPATLNECRLRSSTDLCHHGCDWRSAARDSKSNAGSGSRFAIALPRSC